MKLETKLIYFFFFLLIIPISYPITLEELIDSYDYAYSSGQIDVIDIINYGNDTDGDSLYDHLIINITVDNDEGNYTFIGDLYGNGDLVATTADTYYLTGQNTIQLYYNAKLLQNGIYNLSLTIQENYLTVYRDDNAHNFSFDNDGYEKPDVSIEINSDELIDNDDDGKNEILRINATINSTINEDFEINALIGNGKTINSKKNYTLTNGINNISIDFDGKEIRRERINNSRLYLITIRNGISYQFDLDYPLIYNLYDFDAEQSILKDSYSDGRVDLDDNNLSEFLEINISLELNESGIYSIELEIDDLHGNYVKRVKGEFDLSKEEQSVSFKINGTDIYNSKINGPYLLEYVELSKDNIILDSVSKPYITDNYNYDEFERPLMPDLVVKSLEINENNVKINLANEGNGYAFAFNLEIFDDSFASIGKGWIDYLAPGDSENISYDANISDISELYAVVDYNNDIEESNESNNLFTKNLEEEGIKFNISLTKGWNLASSPLNFTNITEIFESIKDDFVSMFIYVTELQKFIEIDPFSDEEIDLTYGAWIKVSENVTVSIAGKEFENKDMSLIQGWNLVGYPSLNESFINETLKDVNYSVVYSYDQTWSGYIPNRPFNTLTKFIPGFGYWVKID